jgi:hypothetical protein
MWELNLGQNIITHRLVASCESFAVGHEFGHIILNKTKGKIVEYTDSIKVVQNFLSQIKDLTDKEKSELLEPWVEEICADRIGLQLSLSRFNSKSFKDWEVPQT